MSIVTGDLVVVVRRSCSCDHDVGDVGKIFYVRSIEWLDKPTCNYCKKGTEAAMFAKESDGNYFDIPCLRKIEPLPESETTDRKEELTA